MTDSPLDALFSSAHVLQRRDFLIASTTMLAGSLTGAHAAVAEDTNVRQAVSDADRKYMSEAIQLMRKAGVVDKTGGPFGAVIVRNGEVLAATGNSVLRDNDPSAHAEVNAMRAACKKIGAPNLEGAVMFSSCEPCPMCYSTAYWARVDKIYYAAAWSDYADLFDDYNISVDLERPYADRTVKIEQIMQQDAQKVWLEYRELPQKTRY
ncbi:nucleoside deaminase [Pseudochelatococcus sp. G4_1912]|uniref:nucleoside deaminase n=1 Tax=Pseudochelatococcus sp. G4_1912 TaxID=3114288 RepID=UPI0039C5CE7E